MKIFEWNTLGSVHDMPPLKNLQREHPTIDDDFILFCAHHDIVSVDDFLVHDIYELVALATRERKSEQLKKGITEVLSIIDTQHQPWLNGLGLLKDVELNKLVLATGCDGIDDLLQGGLMQGQLIELTGSSSSGKTQVCMQATSHIATKYSGTIVFLDTGNSFSSKRVAHMVNCHLPSSMMQERHGILQEIMSKIQYHAVFDIFTLSELLNQLKAHLTSQGTSAGKRILFIVVDSISSLMTPFVGCKDSTGRSLMVSTGFLLKKLAYEHNISILVTNHMVVGDGGVLKPALGESWKPIPHVRLLISHQQGNVYNATILKHSFMVRGQMTSFGICDKR